MHSSYVAYILDTLQSLGTIRIRKMFGSYGLYKDNIFFALISDNILYFKINDHDKPLYQAHGSKPFSYTKKDGTCITMSYWEVPLDIIENRQKLALWINQAVKAAQQKK